MGDKTIFSRILFSKLDIVGKLIEIHHLSLVKDRNGVLIGLECYLKNTNKLSRSAMVLIRQFIDSMWI